MSFSQPTLTPRRRIAPLPEALASQIAAGEVVERPASVVKELVENALDAGATCVEVIVEGGGADLVRIIDDGAGIPPEELPLAVAPHATSKVCTIDELGAVSTFGFRGEALASLASVSRLRIVSRPRGFPEASAIEVDAGRGAHVMPAAGALGTTIDVRQLFAAVPARRKFLKSPRTEAARCADIVELLSLAHPQVTFRLQSDGRAVVDLPATDHLRQRVMGVMGPEAEEALEVRAEGDVEDSDSLRLSTMSVWGLVSRPEAARVRGSTPRLLVNGRPIQDRALVSAVREAFRGLVEPGALPPSVLLLTIPPHQVDVNVHPAKTEVRFRHPSAVWKLVRDGVRHALRSASLVPEAGALLSGGALGKARVVGAATARDPASHLDANEAADPALPIDGSTVEPIAAAATAPSTPVPVATMLTGTGAVLQVDRTWLVFEEAGAIVVADQHALHERVMFEILKERVSREPLPSQRLLLPDIIGVSAEAMLRLESLAAVLARVGFDLAPAGPRSISVSGVPTFLLERGVEPTPFLRVLLTESSASSLSDDSESVLASVLDMMACKAAVKAGDRLTGPEVAQLLAMRESTERSSSCPHGRPTSIRIPLADIERRFGRR